MNILRLLLILLLPLSVYAADSDMVTLTELKDGITGFRYVWQVPPSTLARLPAWSPTEAEAPLSPHKATKAALAEVTRHFHASARLRAYSISLQQHEPKGSGAVWVYHVSFESEPAATGRQKSLLEVLVLLDGSVVPSFVTPVK